MSDTLAIDPHDVEERRTERARRLAVIELPLVRLGGSILLSIGVLLNNRYVLHQTSLTPWVQVTAALAVWCALSWAILALGFRLNPPIDFTVAAFVCDMIVWTLAIYLTGAEQSWLFFILLMRVGDQTQTTLRRCLAFAFFGTCCYAAMLAWIVIVDGRAIDPSISLVKTAFLLISGLYIAMAARTAEARRERLTHTIRLSRDLIRQLEEQSEQLREAQRHAEAASAAKSDFVASVSHEMRTPLHGILGMLQLAEEKPLDSDVRRHLDLAKHSAELLAETIDEILDFSKIEARSLDLAPTWFEVRDLVRDVVSTLEMTAAAKGMSFTAHVADETPRRAWGDVARLRQVLMNLAGNAIKFTERGSVMIHVVPREQMLAFSVRDTGVGIDAATRAQIFEPFVQGDARRFSGTGLGLAISRRIVEAMGGTIEVESELNQGSTFRFAIATRFDFNPAPAPALHRESSTDDDSARTRQQTVLVVDDNLVNQEFAAEAVRRLGHEVVVASSGEEALDLAAFRLFDLVLMDIQMPGIDGLEATRRLRAAGSLMRIVALTAHSTPEDRQRCLEAGMDDVLVKPVNTARVAAILHGPIPDSIVSNPVLFARVREAFHTQTPALLARMSDAIASSDAAALARDAHTMKGALSNFDAAGAIDAALTLERKGKAGDLSGAKEVFARLVMAVRSLEKSL